MLTLIILFTNIINHSKLNIGYLCVHVNVEDIPT